MDWSREGEVLDGILALLVAFAGLADRAAGLSLAGQLPVLAYLAEAEAIGRSVVANVPSGAPAAVATSRIVDRAGRLAAEFRALARVLRAAIARGRRLCDLSARPSLPPRAPCGATRRPVPAPPAPDTS